MKKDRLLLNGVGHINGYKVSGRPRSSSRSVSAEDALAAQLFEIHRLQRLVSESAETAPGAAVAQPQENKPAGATERIDLDDSLEVKLTHFDPERVRGAFEASPDEYFDSLLDSLGQK